MLTQLALSNWTQKDIWTIAMSGCALAVSVFVFLRDSWRHRKQNRVRFLVTPKVGWIQHGALVSVDHGSLGNLDLNTSFAVVEVINESHFPVILESVGFRCRGFHANTPKFIEFSPMAPKLTNGAELPYEMKRKESVVVMVDKMNIRGLIALGPDYAYAKASDGTINRGKSRIMQTIRDLWSPSE